MGLEGLEDASAHFFFVFLTGQVANPLAADVGGHDDDGVGEVHGASVAVGEAAVVEDLKEDVEDLAVGFFDLVEQDDGVWSPADGFGEASAFLVADVARGCPDESGDGVFFHELGHVESDHGVLVVEEEFGECLAQFGLAHSGWSEEEEGTNGSAGVL